MEKVQSLLWLGLRKLEIYLRGTGKLLRPGSKALTIQPLQTVPVLVSITLPFTHPTLCTPYSPGMKN